MRMIGIRLPVRAGLFLFATTSRPVLGPAQPPVQWILGAFTPRVKRAGGEANHSSPYSAKVKNACSHTAAPPYVLTAWFLVKPRDNFTLPYLTFTSSMDNFASTITNYLNRNKDSNKSRKIAFHSWHSVSDRTDDEIWDNQNDDGETRVIFEFIRTCLNDLTL
jgi:hypothetical protein